jgi:pimeloyl-ACP methyl ester carboxylesterase
MHQKSSANLIKTKEGFDVYYWVTKSEKLTKDFVVLYPGSSMNHTALEELEKGLNESGHPTLILDPRGFGYSYLPAKKELYSLDLYVDDLKRIIEQENLINPILIGHSFGFSIISKYASDIGNTKKVIGICGSHNFSETSKSKILFYSFDKFFRYFEYLGSSYCLLRHFILGRRRKYTNQNLVNGSHLEIYLSVVDVSFEEIKVHIVAGIDIAAWNITEELKKIETPLFLIYGEKDWMITKETGEKIQKLVKGECKVKTLQGVHALPIMEPKKVLDEIIEIL